jgi:hypothetical protein
MRDFYCLDTGSGANTSYLGDVDIVELFPNGPGVHSAWAANVGPFTVTAVCWKWLKLDIHRKLDHGRK